MSPHRYEWVEHGEGKGTALWGPISQWDMSSVTSMQYSFSVGWNNGAYEEGYNAKAKFFNADISQWITSAVTDMSHLFSRAEAFTGSLTKWDVGAVTSMTNMFSSAHLWNGDISKWNVAKVRRMTVPWYWCSCMDGELRVSIPTLQSSSHPRIIHFEN